MSMVYLRQWYCYINVIVISMLLLSQMYICLKCIFMSNVYLCQWYIYVNGIVTLMTRLFYSNRAVLVGESQTSFYTD